MMTHRLPAARWLPILVLGLLLPGPGVAGSLQGAWNAVRFAERNKVESWTPACGKRPPAVRKRPGGAHKLKVFNREFNIFRGTKRVLSSYKCNSRNDSVREIKHTTKGDTHTTTCGSKRSDDLYEVGTYTFRVVNDDRIEYQEQTTLLNTAGGSECSHRRTVKGLFVRAGSEEERLALAEIAAAKARAAAAKGGAVASPAGCPPPDAPRPIARVALTPASHTLAPGQTACYEARALDANGCPVQAAPKFALVGLPAGVKATVDAKGCLKVADAPGLGVDFNVVAAVGPRQARAKAVIGIRQAKRTRGAGARRGKRAASGGVEVSVVSLEATGEVDADWLARHREELKRRREATGEAGGTNWLLLGLFLALLVGGGVLVAFLVRGHGKASAEEEVYLYLEQAPAAREEIRASVHTATAAPEAIALKRCAKCGKTFQSNARFCPFDGHEFGTPDQDSAAAKARAAGGQLRRCPTCQRTFESKGKFCPFDRTRLVAVTADQAAAPRAGDLRRRCPECGRVFEQGKFCPFDRQELVDAPVATPADDH